MRRFRNARSAGGFNPGVSGATVLIGAEELLRYLRGGREDKRRLELRSPLCATAFHS